VRVTQRDEEACAHDAHGDGALDGAGQPALATGLLVAQLRTLSASVSALAAKAPARPKESLLEVAESMRELAGTEG
jgi:hypothetical protein